MTTTARILIVEDDENLRLVLEDNLVSEGYAVTAVPTAAGALSALSADGADLVVLDLMLPDSDGYTLCRQLRGAAFTKPILMLTARTLEEDLVRGFAAGADDYLGKPYRLRELLARVKALLRRAGAASPAAELVRFGDFTLDVASRRLLEKDGTEIEMTKTELDLVRCLVEHHGRVLSRDEILDEVWGKDVNVDARTVDNFVSSLRKKLRWQPSSPFQIATVRGVGYRMTLDE